MFKMLFKAVYIIHEVKVTSMSSKYKSCEVPRNVNLKNLNAKPIG